MLIALFLTMSLVNSSFGERTVVSLQGDCLEKDSWLNREGELITSSLKKTGWKINQATNQKDFFAHLEKIANSRILAGDELILNFSLHGGPASAYRDHVLMLPDCTNLSVGDPRLKAVLTKIKKNGIKIGILDSSCYGGASVPVLEKFGCVVTHSESNFEASSNTSEHLNEGALHGAVARLSQQKNKTLEDVYLSALVNDSFSHDSHNTGAQNFPLLSEDIGSIKVAEAGAAVISLHNRRDTGELGVAEELLFLIDEKFAPSNQQEKVTIDELRKTLLKDYITHLELSTPESRVLYFNKLKKEAEENKCTFQENSVRKLDQLLTEANKILRKEQIIRYSQYEKKLGDYLSKENSFKNINLSFSFQVKKARDALNAILKLPKDLTKSSTYGTTAATAEENSFAGLEGELTSAINIMRAYEYLDKRKPGKCVDFKL